jgi:hypothetical protein
MGAKKSGGAYSTEIILSQRLKHARQDFEVIVTQLVGMLFGLPKQLVIYSQIH